MLNFPYSTLLLSLEYAKLIQLKIIIYSQTKFFYPFTGKTDKLIGCQRNGKYILLTIPETVRQAVT